MAIVLMIVNVLIFYGCSAKFEPFIYAEGGQAFLENAYIYFKSGYIALVALTILAAALGMAFVGKTPGAKSFWVGLSRVLSVIGALGFLGFGILLKNVIDPSDPFVGPVCQFLFQLGTINLVNFIALFFRRKP